MFIMNEYDKNHQTKAWQVQKGMTLIHYNLVNLHVRTRHIQFISLETGYK